MQKSNYFGFIRLNLNESMALEKKFENLIFAGWFGAEKRLLVTYWLNGRREPRGESRLTMNERDCDFLLGLNCDDNANRIKKRDELNV